MDLVVDSCLRIIRAVGR